jgi:hypothetical protein
MTEKDGSDRRGRSLRQRVREAGGWYAYLNATLIKAAGPAAVGPYETTPPPSAEERAERGCPLCGRPMADHTFDRTGIKPLLRCP